MNFWVPTFDLVQEAIDVSSRLEDENLFFEAQHVFNEAFNVVRTRDDLAWMVRRVRKPKAAIWATREKAANYQEILISTTLRFLVQSKKRLPIVSNELRTWGRNEAANISETSRRLCLEPSALEIGQMGDQWLREGRIEGVTLRYAYYLIQRPYRIGEFARELLSNLGQVKKRQVAPIDDELAGKITGLARRFAHYGFHQSAFSVGLLTPFLRANKADSSFVERTVLPFLEPEGGTSPGKEKSVSPLEVGTTLVNLGYPAQAVEFYQAAVSSPTSSEEKWKNMWQVLEKNDSANLTAEKPSRVQAFRDLKWVPALKSFVRFVTRSPVSFEKAISDVLIAGLATTAVGARVQERESKVAKPRAVNVWIESDEYPVAVNKTVTLGVNIGEKRIPTESETALGSQRFKDPPWGKRQKLELLIGLVGPYVKVEPAWRKAILPRQGAMEPVYFDVTAGKPGKLELTLMLRLPKSMTLLQEYQVELSAEHLTKDIETTEVIR